MRINNAEVLSTREVKGGEGAGAYRFDTVRVFDREAADVFELRVGDEYGRPPSVGEVISAVVSVRVYTGKGAGAVARLNIELVRPLQNATPTAVPKAS